MKCTEFEMIVNDLAHGRVIEEENLSERERALQHATSCHACAARLADEQRLSAGLKALVRVEENRNVPPGIEAALLASFRQNALKETVPPVKSYWSRMPRWAWAAAAAVLLALGILAAGTFRKESGNNNAIVEPISVPAIKIVDLPDKKPGRENNQKVRSNRKPKRTGHVLARGKPVVPISDRVLIK